MQLQGVTVRTVEAGLLRRCVPLAIVASLAAALWAPPAMAQTITDLGTLPGYLRSTAMAINDNGQVAGYSTDVSGFTTHGFLYSNGTMTDLGTLGGTFSAATGINSIGQVVGYSSLANGMTHAFLYSNGVMTDLGTLPGGNSSSASAINSSGDIVGWANIVGGPPHAILYSKGAMTDLGTLPGYIQSFATAINSSGQIAGYAMGSWHNFHAFVYSNGVFTDLGALYTGYSWALGINDSGQVTGYISPQTGLEHAFLYSDGVLTDVGALVYSRYDVWVNSRGYGINSSGQIAGTGDPGAFLFADGYSISGTWLTWYFTAQAYAINATGQVVGTTEDPSQGPAFSQGHAFVLETAGRPVITGLSPNSVNLGSGNVTLTVTGKNFTPEATVAWDSSGRPTTYVSATELTVQLSSSDIVASSFKNYITVSTPVGMSGAVIVPIVPPAPRAKPGDPERQRPRGTSAPQ
jgi:probable HAF family extracellular repeat protein